MKDAMIHARRYDTWKTIWYTRDIMIHERRYDNTRIYDTWKTLWYMQDVMIHERRYDTLETLWYTKDDMIIQEFIINERRYNTYKTLGYITDALIRKARRYFIQKKKQDCVFMNPCILLLHSIYSNKCTEIYNNSLKICFRSKVFIFREMFFFKGRGSYG